MAKMGRVISHQNERERETLRDRNIQRDMRRDKNGTSGLSICPIITDTNKFPLLMLPD